MFSSLPTENLEEGHFHGQTHTPPWHTNAVSSPTLHGEEPPSAWLSHTGSKNYVHILLASFYWYPIPTKSGIMIASIENTIC